MPKESYKKGQDFQVEFSDFLKSELDWAKTSIETPVNGAINSQGTKVDIIAERLNKKGQVLKNIGKFYITACAILISIVIVVACAANFEDGGILFAIVLFGGVLEIAGIALFNLGVRNNTEHAWVECKNHETKVNKDQVRKMLDEYHDYVNSKDRKYRVKKLYFASGSGYIKNAIEYAMHNGVECYEKVEGKFVKAKFWN